MNTLLHLLNLFAFLVCHSTITIMIIPVVDSQCIPDQQQTLLNLKSSLVYNASLSSKLVTWNNRTDCCSWRGVTCSTNGRVLGLDISSESISDDIDNSSSLFLLQNLQSLNLASNQLGRDGSSIPSAFGLLVSLRYIYISDNHYSGQIPVEISRLTRLVVLDISHNEFDLDQDQNQDQNLKYLEIPTLNMLVENLTQLRELYLDHVQISQGGNQWSQTISSSLPNLRILSMSNCNLSGPFHHSLAKRKSLSVIQLSWNNFNAPVPPFFANFSNLTSLYLTSCDLQGTFPHEVFQLPSLREIALSLNYNLHGWLPEFPKNGSLQELDLRLTNFSGVLPNSIGNLNMLSTFYINDCNFKGTIPESMANLTRLVELWMPMNEFEGSIPSFNGAKNLEILELSYNDLTGNIDHINWTSLSKLSILGLSPNQLSGNIPSALFSLPVLQYLDLSDNQFSGQFPTILNMSSSSLINLDLSRNNLEGSIPMSIFNLRGLTDLDLSSNNFSGSFLLDGLQHFRNLIRIDLSQNNLFLSHDTTNSSNSFFPKLEVCLLASGKLRTFPHFLRNQSELTSLDLSDNQIHSSIPNWIWRFRSLSYLNLSCNFLEGSSDDLPINLTSMSILDLHSNLFHGTIPISSAPEMNYLDYSRNNFNSTIPTTIGDMCPILQYFSVASNNLQGIIPQSICSPLYLDVLDMSNNSISGDIPQCLTALSTLSVLNLRRNNLTSVNKVLSPNCSLQTLDLSENQIHGEIPKTLSNCVNLEVLNLGSNQMTGPFPCFLKSISSLKVLVLRSNRFHGIFGCPHHTNESWPMLQIVDIADNNFSGDVPRRELTTWQAMKFKGRQSKVDQLQYQDDGSYNNYKDTVKVTIKGVEIELEKILTIFTTVDLSCNKFSGSIPEEIGGLNALHLLNLSNNAFSGAIPTSLSNLSQLESLDLSHNTLSGHIPVQLTRLTFLSFLNLSNNQLEGMIPSSTQFSTFPKSSFEENKGLFGPPLTEDNITKSSPSTTTKRSHQNSGDEIDWKFISVEMGFTCGMGVAIGSLLFCKRWRIWYHMTMYGILVRVFPQLEHWFGHHRRHVYIGERHIRRRRTLR